MKTRSVGNFNIFIITFGIIAIFILIIIIVLPLIIKKCCRKRKTSSSTEDLEFLLKPTEESVLCKQIEDDSIIEHEYTKMECTIEYRTRGTQLIISVRDVEPAVCSWQFLKESKNIKVFLLIYIDGDVINSPCQSTKHNLEKSIRFHETFIFTIMPYDISSLHLVFQAVIGCGNWMFDIGNVRVPLSEHDLGASGISKSLHLSITRERSVVNECMLSVSLTKCKNAIKFKVVKLYFLDAAVDTKRIGGIHVRVQITDFQNPLQYFDTTKKKYNQFLTFNELKIFQIDQTMAAGLELEIQLLESYNIDREEIVSVCGRIVLFYNNEEVNDDGNSTFKSDDHLSEVFNNPEVEIVRYHTIPYVFANR